ncbi:Uncharacterized protein MCB1EB_1615 [Mycoavidus cysteinexigens]|uniref:Uncharacterized protein n=2 Tax=Mycoavidus cysteinexigens TaxID=1553431 RepID=A0A2Z6EWH9_9BURK|nr:Uncharacterized protein MCB1EB_1615 [Mycoavidus cysteinexigens]GAM53881.1 hypothetical protein EBME_2344 [bacterium endosymbiont of Mortierella elongata FMR23-6]GLR01082.1 hypothetical protein GCM10007934_08940 [Mycoavidus cysteinexigens]
MGGFVRLFSQQLPVLLILTSALLASSAAWKVQEWRYTGQIYQCKAELEIYQARIATATAQLAEAQAKVVIQTEIQYRDRIKIVKEKGETIIKEVPVYVTQADTHHFGVNVGFVRHYNSAFTGELAGVATELDRRPAGISLAELAEVNAYNASVCWQWREQALGLRAFYQQLQNTHKEMP